MLGTAATNEGYTPRVPGKRCPECQGVSKAGAAACRWCNASFDAPLAMLKPEEEDAPQRADAHPADLPAEPGPEFVSPSFTRVVARDIWSKIPLLTVALILGIVLGRQAMVSAGVASRRPEAPPVESVFLLLAAVTAAGIGLALLRGLFVWARLRDVVVVTARLDSLEEQPVLNHVATCSFEIDGRAISTKVAVPHSKAEECRKRTLALAVSRSHPTSAWMVSQFADE